MMKKLICIILAVFTLLSLVACQPADEPKESSSESSTPEETPKETEPETEPPVSTLKINGTDIAEYTVVVYANTDAMYRIEQAERLAEHFNSLFGCDVNSVAEPEERPENAIIISDCLPPISSTLVIDTVTAAVQGVDGDVWISATNEYTLEAAIDKIIADSTPANAGDTVELDYSGENKTSVVAESLGEILKVMSYNIKTGSPTSERVNNVIKNITDFMPDTIGTQEANFLWKKKLKSAGFLDEYEMVGKPRDKESDITNGNEYSAIFYRKSKFKLIDSGTLWLSDTPDVVNSKLESSEYTRIMTYVVLERISDGVRFAHVNTHMSWDAKGDKTNLKQMKIILKLVDERIYAKHGELPTYFTGDFNVLMTSEGYKHLLSTGKADARKIADVTNDKITFPGNPGKIIDYCIVTEGDFQVATFDVGVDLPGSDHQPVYVEMYITPQE